MKAISVAAVAVVAAAMGLGAAVARAEEGKAYTEGQAVEVREGDTWSKAAILKREGRKYLVHYDGADASSDEWVTAERIRGGAGAAAATRPAVTARPAGPRNAQWAVGQRVEVKWGGLWREAKVVRKGGEWTLVAYGADKHLSEWVEPWRIRKVGSKEDTIGYARPRHDRADQPPKEAVGEPPRDETARESDADRVAEVEKDPAFKKVDGEAGRDAAPEVKGGAVYAADAEQAKVGTRSIVVRRLLSNNDRISDIHASGAYGYATIEGFGGNASSRVARMDLAQGGLAGLIDPGGGRWQFGGASANGKEVALVSDERGAGGKDTVALWSFEQNAPKKVAVFMPYGGQKWPTRDVQEAIALGAGRVMTVNQEGDLVVWDVPAGKAVWRAAANQGSRPGVSAGGKYVAVEGGRSVFVLAAESGDGVKRLDLPGGVSGMRYAFSPSGNRLVGLGGRTVLVWDLQAGDGRPPVGDFTLQVSGSRVDVVNDDYGMLDGKILVDFKRRIPLWAYQQAGSGAGVGGGRLWYAAAGGKEVDSAAVPDARALAMAQTLDPEAELVLKPGTKVSLRVEVGGTDEERKQVGQALADRIRARGYEVADGQPVVFVAHTEPGETKEREYRVIGPGAFGQTEKLSVTEQKARWAVEVNGQTVWEENGTTSPAPMFLRPTAKQSLQDVINEQSKPFTRFFDSVRVPGALTKKREPAWYGESRLGA